MKFKYLLFAIGVFISATAFGQASNWQIAEGYQINFSGTGASGNFGALSGTITFSPDALEASRFEITLDPSQIDTGNQVKNKHAKGSSWFDVKQFPTISYRTNQIKATNNGYEAVGVLEMHGIKKQLAIPFTFKPTQKGGVFEGQFVIDRTDYGIMGPFIGFMVGDEFETTVKVPVTK